MTKLRNLPLSALVLAATALTTLAHGPHIQITGDSGKIITRELLLDAPFSATLTSPKSVYVMPLLEVNGVWVAQPNQTFNSILNLPAYFSGPGLAYGYDQVDGGPQVFETGSVLSVGFTDGLKRWDGTSFVDAGETQLKAFRGSNPEITTPAANFAITTDSEPYDSVSLAAVLENYGVEGAEIHGSIRYTLLGDGISSTSDSPDGVYLLGLQVSSTQSGLDPSDPYYFVLHKNAPISTIVAAVNSLGIDPALQQWVVPEPATSGLIVLAVAGMCALFGCRRAKC